MLLINANNTDGTLVSVIIRLSLAIHFIICCRGGVTLAAWRLQKRFALLVVVAAAAAVLTVAMLKA